MQSVYQAWSGTLRFGNVAEERTERGWKYYRVDWVDDELYEHATHYMLGLRNDEYDPKYEWHRSDHVRLFDPDEFIEAINKLGQFP